MNLIKDMISVNKETFTKTLNSLKKSWVIMFTGLAYMIINLLIYTVIFRLFTGSLSIIAGLVASIASASLISNYLYLLYNVINYDRISFQDFKDGFSYFLRKVYMVFFFAYIGNILISTLGGVLGPNINILNMLINLSILVLLNALPETIYQKHYDPLDSIVYSLDFMKDNWYNWLLPNIILYFILFVVTGNMVTDLFATNISFGMLMGGSNIIRYFIGQFLFSFIMIYRGHLYKILSTSNLRKRMFMGKF